MDDEFDQEAIVRALRARDEAAFRRLVGAWHAGMRRTAGVLARDESSGEEIAQETWLAVIAGIDQFEGRSSLKSWVYAILARKARARIGPRQRREALWAAERARFDERGGWREPPAPWAHGPERVAEQRELLRRIERAVRALPERQALAIWLCDVQGWSGPQAAEALETTPNNARVLLHRARQAVRAALERDDQNEGS